MKNFALLIIASHAACLSANAQIQFSLATDASIMRNLSPHQKFWSFGQTIQGNFHLGKKESAYFWFAYYTPGKFKNIYAALAKQPGTDPAQISYTVSGRWQPRQISLGWKHYFFGAFDNEEIWNVYTTVGFGLMYSKVQNTFNTSIDTAKYSVLATPVVGNGSFKRLTFDLGLGTELALGSDIYLYSDVRVWLPASDNNPSPYFHDSQKVPLPVTLNLGLRILFNFDYTDKRRISNK